MRSYFKLKYKEHRNYSIVVLNLNMLYLNKTLHTSSHTFCLLKIGQVAKRALAKENF